MAQIVIRLKERELQRVPVTRVATRIGRDEENDVVIANDGISRHHATLRYDAAEGVFVIHDTSSSNGVYVRGRPTPYARLTNGDEAQLGKFTLVLLDEGGPPLDALLPEDVAVAVAPKPLVRNPLPTMAVRAITRPKFQSPPPRPLIAALSDAPPAAVEAPPAQPLTASPLKAPPDDDAPAPPDQAALLRRVTWLLVLLVALLLVVIVLLVRR